MWAWKLARNVLTQHGWTRDQLEELRFTWTRRTGTSSSGRTWYGPPKGPRIHVSAGTSELDQRHVVLHECAHLLTPHHFHDRRFWLMAWRLYKEQGESIPYTLARESMYRQEAVNAARLLGLDTAGTTREAAMRTVASAFAAEKPLQLSLIPNA